MEAGVPGGLFNRLGPAAAVETVPEAGESNYISFQISRSKTCFLLGCFVLRFTHLYLITNPEESKGLGDARGLFLC